MSLRIKRDSRSLSPNDVATIMKVTQATVKYWIYHRKLSATKIAHDHWKIKIKDFEAFLRSRAEIGRRHVLITDASNSGKAEVVAAVESLGHFPVCPRNYSDALLKALNRLPDLFILCLGSSEANGWVFSQKIRAAKSLRKIPILLIGGASITDADAECAMRCRAKGIICRPLSVEVLKNEISRILSRMA